ncbi:MAG: hypothetical protein FD171_19 [Actinobacteria bacterium]|nr:MAG: hypothetical protein FD171_19 [Actinomycetota bacterium]
MKRNRIVAIGVTAALAFGTVGWGTAVGAGEAMGVMTTESNAKIVVADQVGATTSVTIELVRAPKDAFVVVHQFDGTMPGKRIGYAAVEKGDNTDVKVTLDPDVPLTAELVAAIHTDAGVRGELEFDMDNMERSPDRPFFIGETEVAAPFKVADFGVPVKMGEAAIQAGDQPLGTTVTIGSATAPADAFVVVHKAKDDGMPGERLGFTPIKAGENKDVVVELDGKVLGTVGLIAAIHVDADGDGELEFDMDDPVGSPDQPYFADGMEVAVQFNVGPFGIDVSRASIEASDQIGAEGTIVIDEVDAPEDAWIVVHKAVDGAPGDRVGLQRVKKGQSSDIEVKLTEGLLPEQLIVALHADRGDDEVFDFDMMDKLGSPDQPFFVDGKEVAVVVAVRTFGYATPAGTSAIIVADQAVRDALLTVNLASSPEPAWIVVHLDAGGVPGARVGLLHIPAGTTTGAIVQLDASKPLTDTLFVAVHADRPEPGMFEFDMMDRVNSPDQPFFVDGAEVATAVSVR